MKWNRAKAAMVLAVAFLFLSMGQSFAATLDEQLQETQNQQENLSKKIGKYQDDEETLKQQIAQTQGQISATKNQLAQLAKELSAANAEVSTAEKSLKETEDRLNARNQALQKRIRGVYEEGQVGYLELLFQSASLGDFVNRLEYLGKILANDQKLVSEISKEKKDIGDKRNALVKKRDSVAQVKSRQEQQNFALQQQQGNYQAQLKKDKALLDELWDELKDSQAEEQRIRDLIRGSNVKDSSGNRPGALLWPVPSVRSISSKFGYRTHPIYGTVRLHAGIDIPAPMGSAVDAAASGVVMWAGSMSGYGYTVIIDHGGGLQTLYAHLSAYAVKTGDRVSAGQLIARSGGAAGAPGAGTSTGAHLHFETRINGAPEDPLNYL